MSSKPLCFTDVSLTDGQTAVWGGAMTTPMMAKVIGSFNQTAHSGKQSLVPGTAFPAIEVISTETVRQCLARGEDPWQRIEVLRYQNPAQPFRASINLLTDQRPDVLSTEVVAHWIEALARRSISQVVVVDPLLQKQRLAPAFRAAKDNHMVPIGVVPFLEDQRSDDQYAEIARGLVTAGAARVMLRDEGGVLTPDRISSLLPRLQQVLEGIPLLLHTRCTTGLGPLVAIEAIRSGVSEIDTALPALANGASLPSSTTLTRSLDIVEVPARTPDLKVSARVNDLLCDIAEREDFPPAQPWVFDLAPFIHQLPGEVAAYAVERLGARGEEHRLHEFSRECARIREDIGSTPMSAPFGRAIAEQAFLNLSGGARYTEIRPVIRRSLQGAYGQGADSEVDSRLLAWVGALPPKSPSPCEVLCSREPQASPEQQIIEQIGGLKPEQQPGPAPIEELVYRETTPLESLEAGLEERSDRLAGLSVEGPGVNLKVNSGGG